LTVYCAFKVHIVERGEQYEEEEKEKEKYSIHICCSKVMSICDYSDRNRVKKENQKIEKRQRETPIYLIPRVGRS
jgi:hypothetical protein